jgi:hypothetical protein
VTAPSLNRDILRLAVPALGALIAEPLFLIVDAALVGHLGVVPSRGSDRLGDAPDHRRSHGVPRVFDDPPSRAFRRGQHGDAVRAGSTACGSRSGSASCSRSSGRC